MRTRRLYISQCQAEGRSYVDGDGFSDWSEALEWRAPWPSTLNIDEDVATSLLVRKPCASAAFVARLLVNKACEETMRGHDV